ncbi:MAG: hypothetical protein ACXVPQ_09455, partial [Bacteroidia bacterium]
MFQLVSKQISCLAFFCGCFFISVSQTGSIIVKASVKADHVLLRWMPSDMTLLDIGAKHGYRIVRYEGAVSSSVVIAASMKPYEKNDTLRWKLLFNKNPRAILVLKAIYEKQSKAGPKQKQDQELMLFSMLALSCDFDPAIAMACGLYIKDSTASPSQTYTYKIMINQPPPALNYKPAELIVNCSVQSSIPFIGDLKGTFKNKAVKLKWKAADYKTDFAGYTVERSEDSIHFKAINKSPLVFLSTPYEKKKEHLFYNDTVPLSGKTYFYRIRGITHFGELSAPSNIVSGKGFAALRSMPVIDSIRVVENKNVFMHWRMKDTSETKLPETYILLRSTKDKGPYHVILNSKQLKYIDGQPESSNYYKIAAVAKGGDTLYSYSYLALIIDSVPPAPPEGLSATVDAKGHVMLTWTKNAEPDVQGYKVFKANALNEEFVQINQQFARSPSYKDMLNLKTLSKTIYYCVAATDKNYNNSALSKPIEVKRPDTISPVAPIITELRLSDGGIRLKWIVSSSEDVKQYVLYRQDEKTKTDLKLSSWPAKDSLRTYADTSAEEGHSYRYKLLVSDQDDNISISNIPYISFETGFRKKIQDIRFDTDRTLKLVRLRWGYPEKDIEKYIIYRAKKDGPLSIIKTLSAPAQQF